MHTQAPRAEFKGAAIVAMKPAISRPDNATTAAATRATDHRRRDNTTRPPAPWRRPSTSRRPHWYGRAPRRSQGPTTLPRTEPARVSATVLDSPASHAGTRPGQVRARSPDPEAAAAQT